MPKDKKRANKTQQQIHYKKNSDDANFRINIGNRGSVLVIEEIKESTAENENEAKVIPVYVQPLGIAPVHVRDMQIKKPEEKEPSLRDMIRSRLRGGDKSKNQESHEAKIKSSKLNISSPR